MQNIEATYYLPLRTNRVESLMGSFVQWIGDSIPGWEGNVPWHDDAAAAPTGASALDGIETCYWDYAKVNNSCVTAPPSVTGNLLWMLHLVEQAGAYTGGSTAEDWATRILFPVLTKALNAYLAFEEDQGAQGVHLPETFSPEYMYRGPDTTYDLALYRWGLGTALRLAKAYNLNHPNLDKYADNLNRLTPYPVDPATGWEIARGVPLNRSHRHYSHLLQVWPLQTANLGENETETALAKQSIDHWIGMTGALTGFCRPAVATMSLLLGRPVSSFTNVSYLATQYLQPNTMYEEGHDGSCTETPYLGAKALADQVLLEHNGTLLPFLGIFGTSANETLADPSFAFLGATTGPSHALLLTPVHVSAKINAQRTDAEWIHITAVDKGSVIIQAPFNGDWAIVSSPPGATLTPIPPLNLSSPVTHHKRFQIDGLEAGANVTLYPTANPPTSLRITPAPGCPQDFNSWGMPPKSVAPNVQIAPCDNGTHPNASQKFDFIPAPGMDGAGVFQLASEPSLCLGVTSCQVAEDTPVAFLPCPNSDVAVQPGCSSGCDNDLNMYFKFSNVTAPNRLTTMLAPDQYCLDIPGAEGPTVDLAHCDVGTRTFKNLAFVYSPDTGALISLLTRPGWGPNFCVTKT